MGGLHRSVTHLGFYQSNLTVNSLFRNPRFLTALTVSALGLVLWALVALALYQDPREARALKTEGAIVGVTLGNEPLVVGANWQKLLLRAFPQFQKQIGGGIIRPDHASPKSVTVWQNFGPLSVWAGRCPCLCLKLFDDQGKSLKVETYCTGGGMIGDLQLWSFPVHVFPRRAGIVRMRFTEGSFFTAHPADVLISNPDPRSEPRWVPMNSSANPARDGLEVDLVRLNQDTVVLGNGNWPFTTPTASGSALTFSRKGSLDLRLRENGRPAFPSWRVEQVELIEATGKSCHRWADKVSGKGERIHVDFLEGFLDPGHSFHQVRLRFARSANFPEEEIWTIPNLQIPGLRQEKRLGMRRKLGDHTVEITGLRGKGGKVPEGRPNDDSTAEVRVFAPANHYCLRAWIDEGKGFEEVYVSPLDQNAPCCVRLREGAQRGTVRLKLALTRRHTFEFRDLTGPPTSPREASHADPD